MFKSARKRTFIVLEAGRSDDWLSRFVDYGLTALIIVNVVAVILESTAAYATRFGPVFEVFERFSVAIFTIEYGLRVWSAVEIPGAGFDRPIIARLRYMLTPMALIDLIVVLPFYLTFFVTLDLRSLRILRLMRIFKLTRYSTAMGLIIQVIKDEARPIGAALVCLMMMVIIAASLLYITEHAVQPEAFGSIPSAMWWAIVTITTVGYGDVTPISPIGKVLGAVITIISVGIVALPAGLLASGFNDAIHLRRKDYEHLVDHIIADDIVTDEEAERLEQARLEIGLSIKEANAILRARLKHKRVLVPNCPHCGKAIAAMSGAEEES